MGSWKQRVGVGGEKPKREEGPKVVWYARVGS